MKFLSTIIIFLITIITVSVIVSSNEQKTDLLKSQTVLISRTDTLAVGQIIFRADFGNEIYTDSEGIKITVQNSKNGITHETISDKDGLFYLKDLSDGLYEIIQFELKKSTDKYILSYTLMLELFFEVRSGKINNLGKIDWNFDKKEHDIKYSREYFVTKIKFETQHNAADSEWTDTVLSENAPVSDKRDMDDENWDAALLDTARDATYLTPVEKDVILEMNKVRSNPKKYADLYIKPRLQYYSENNMYSPPGKMPIKTTEGVKAAQECYEVLSKISPVQLLIPSKGLWQAAKDHASDQSKTGEVGHDGSDGSSPFDRIKRYGTYKMAGENIAYKPNTGREIVVGLLIDDGVFSRGHRDNIMHKEYNHVGATLNSHNKYGVICVIEYAKDFISNRY
ncbi:MAG: CAP domain-containing protein [Campylobacteraceae bacterium]|jgi:uncharacterized protein YkwD|nr:CAP domain-containing protein [Campylobacteraceae bacterium]